MNVKVVALILTASLLGLTSCEKPGATFSIASDQSQFQQAATFVPRKLDVLFVVDNSGSMQTSQTNLARNFPSFINYFKSKGYDFRIAITTTDAYYGEQFISAGCSLCNAQQTQFRASADATGGIPVRIVENSTPNLDFVFSANAQVGTRGSGDERAFSSLKAALGSQLNAGFHRADAYLALIIVSDSDDFSHDDININESYAQPTLHPTSTYVNYLNTFTNALPKVDYSVSTIGVLDPACRDLLAGENKIAIRYMELSDLTGGTKNSICAPFNTALDNISASIASNTQAQFKINRKPVLSSIRVIINGVLVPKDPSNGWTYNQTTMIITVRGTYSPEAGASIVINFDPESVN